VLADRVAHPDAGLRVLEVAIPRDQQRELRDRLRRAAIEALA